MTTLSDEDDVAAARWRMEQARDAMHAAMERACPGPHQFTQHRDRRRPWCRACRRQDDGYPLPSPGPFPHPVKESGL